MNARVSARYLAEENGESKRRETITDNWIASRSQWTPHHGREVTGWPVGTIVRGRRVMWEGALVEGAVGEPARFDR